MIDKYINEMENKSFYFRTIVSEYKDPALGSS